MYKDFPFMFALPDERTIESRLEVCYPGKKFEEFIGGVVTHADKVVTPVGLVAVIIDSYLDSGCELSLNDLLLVACVICEGSGKQFQAKINSLLQVARVTNRQLRVRLIEPLRRSA